MDSERIEQQAANWFAKRASGTWTELNQARFEAWMGERTAHRIAYLRLDAAWQHAARMQALGAGVPAGTIPPKGVWGRGLARGLLSRAGVVATTPADGMGNRRPRRGALMAAAASVLLLLCGGLYVYASHPFGDRYVTAVGKMATVSLTDGSRVTLNTDSSIRVRFTSGERRITLGKGEAFFDVAKDASRPFVVSTGASRVIAVGTKFSVRREGADLRLAVREGKVRVEGAAAAMRWRQAPVGHVSHEAAASGQESEVLVVAGSVLRTAHSELQVQEHAVAEVDRLLSWRQGFVSFKDTSLADAVAEFNRYNPRQMIIADPAVAAIKIGGNFRADNLGAFLWLLQNGFPVTVEQHADSVVLRAR